MDEHTTTACFFPEDQQEQKSAKEGKFGGANTFQHDEDVVIEVPEKGKAVQMGRFNQGGDMTYLTENQLKEVKQTYKYSLLSTTSLFLRQYDQS